MVHTPVLPSPQLVRTAGEVPGRHQLLRPPIAARTRKLERCRQLLGAEPAVPPADPEVLAERVRQLTGVDVKTCPACGVGQMEVIAQLQRVGLRLTPRPRLPPAGVAGS